jgi:prephenate dehydrogenase
MKQKITIIGWTDGFWKWLADFILKNFRSEIVLTITWRNKKKWEELSNKFKSNFTTETKKVIWDSDITIFAVPIDYTVKIIKMYAPYLKLWSVVLDVTSIKKEPSKALDKYAPKWVLVIPTHPMFW